MDKISEELKLAEKKLKENRNFFKNLSKPARKQLDSLAGEAHVKAFKEFDCLDCANCCKGTGPLFTTADISRLAKKFGMKVPEFIESYLKVDNEGDYVFQEVPCPFLLSDNTCLVYEDRPKACREFPHTDRNNFYQIRNLTLKNSLICPITYRVLEEIKSNIKT